MMFGKENAEKLARQARGSKVVPDSNRRFGFSSLYGARRNPAACGTNQVDRKR